MVQTMESTLHAGHVVRVGIFRGTLPISIQVEAPIPSGLVLVEEGAEPGVIARFDGGFTHGLSGS